MAAAEAGERAVRERTAKNREMAAGDADSRFIFDFLGAILALLFCRREEMGSIKGGGGSGSRREKIEKP